MPEKSRLRVCLGPGAHEARVRLSTGKRTPELTLSSKRWFLSGCYPYPVLGTAGLSATPPGPACPSRASGWRSRASAGWGFPCCTRPPCVAMPLPLPRWDRWVESLMGRPIPPVSLFANDGGLPRSIGGSAPTLNLSRPAQHSLALRPVDSLHRRAVHLSRRLRRLRYLRRRSDSFRLERPS